MNVITNKIPMKLILRMKIAYSFLHVMSKLFHTIILSFSDQVVPHLTLKAFFSNPLKKTGKKAVFIT